MNDNFWYPREPQRYLTDTAWCDPATEVAHVRMIDTYYALGKPIKDFKDEIQNIGKIKDGDYVRVTGNLIRLGWWVEKGEWRHKKIEETLSEMESTRQAQIQRTKAATDARKQQRDDERNDNRNDERNVVPITTTTTITGTDTKTDTKTEGKGAASRPPLAAILSAWNSAGPIKCLVISDKRRRQLESRWRDGFFRAHWQRAIEIIGKSKFCNGENDRKWRASFDWFLQPDTVAKTMEGKYLSNPTVKKGVIAV